MSYRKVIALIGLVAALAFASACTSVPAPADDSDPAITDPENQPADSTPAAQEAIVETLPPGFFLSGEFVELGPHDPNDPNIEWIRPCTEIPDAILAGTGLDLEFTVDHDFAGMTSCAAPYMDDELGYTTVFITGGPTPISQYIELGRSVEVPVERRLEEILVHRMSDRELPSCAASVDTNRGLFMVAVDNHNPAVTLDHKCPLALSQFESIYFMLRGES